MNVLHLCPLWFPAAQDAAGGIETFLAALVAALAKLGCRNTISASGDSHTAAELLPAVPTNLYEQMGAGTAWEYAYYEQHQLLLALEQAADYDVVHSHLGPGAYALSGVPRLGSRLLHTLHNPITRDLEWFVRQHPDLWFSTVSEFQARRLREQGARRCHVIPNGIDVAAFTFAPQGGDGLFFIGRIEPGKGPDLAVQVAGRLGCPLVLAGPIIDQQFFDRAIRPFLNGQIEYVGVVDHAQKIELFGRAGCTLLPSRWEEPFGLVAVEAMACGTPVVGLANGALPEIVEPGRTGYLAQDEADLTELVAMAVDLNRSAVRERVAARFDISHVAQKYYDLYREITEE